MNIDRDWAPFRERGIPDISGERAKLWNSTERFVVVAAGRRSGKSVLARRRLVFKLFEAQEWSDPRYFYAAPTQGQVKRIAWEDFKKLIPAECIRSINESELWIKTIAGSELHLIGLDAPQRIEGTPWDGGVIDERADIKAGAWDANIRPSLSDRLGWCWHIGVPDMEGPSNAEFKELYDIGRSGRDPEWASFTWPSVEMLPAKEIQSARRRLPANIFRQEYEASFESAPGRAYYEFTSAVHIQRVEHDPTLPLCVSCDFNFGHHNWGLYQYVGITDVRKNGVSGNGSAGNGHTTRRDHDGWYHIIGEIYLANANVELMVRSLKEYIRSVGANNVVFYGDYSGEQKRAEATKSAWQQIKEAFPKSEYHYKLQPPISDRIGIVNSVFRNAADEIRVKVDPRCRNHIRDFEEVTRTMLFSDNKPYTLTHASDAFGYFVHEHERQLQFGNLDMKKLNTLL